MPLVTVKPGRAYGVERHPEGTVLVVTQEELNVFPGWLVLAEEPAPLVQVVPSVEELMEDSTIRSVKQLVVTGQLAAQEALTFETSDLGKNRSSLILWLNDHS